jgi:hypothetical protein
MEMEMLFWENLLEASKAEQSVAVLQTSDDG